MGDTEMSVSVSANYTKLGAEQIDVVSQVFVDAWQEPHIPRRQWDTVVKEELRELGEGLPSAPFVALGLLLAKIPRKPEPPSLIDVGASSGYYSEVLRHFGFPCKYTAVDFSPYYKDLAGELYPEMEFLVGSALELPATDKGYDIVLHGACIMHIHDYTKAIEEAARVAKDWVIFHRTPVYFDETPTEAFVKTAYGVPCVEFHFNEAEIVGLFYKNGLEIRATADVFKDEHFGHRSYLLAVNELNHHPV